MVRFHNAIAGYCRSAGHLKVCVRDWNCQKDPGAFVKSISMSVCAQHACRMKCKNQSEAFTTTIFRRKVRDYCRIASMLWSFRYELVHPTTSFTTRLIATSANAVIRPHTILQYMGRPLAVDDANTYVVHVYTLLSGFRGARLFKLHGLLILSLGSTQRRRYSRCSSLQDCVDGRDKGNRQQVTFVRGPILRDCWDKQTSSCRSPRSKTSLTLPKNRLDLP